MINQVILTGRITREVELRKTQQGTSVVSFALAVNDRFDKEKTAFINCVAWTHSADFMSKYINKGDLLGVVGRIQTRNYDDKNGNKVYVTEVVVEQVESLNNRRQETTHDDYPQVEDYKNEFKIDIDRDDLPF